jgi:hypothetical protein
MGNGGAAKERRHKSHQSDHTDLGQLSANDVGIKFRAG